MRNFGLRTKEKLAAINKGTSNAAQIVANAVSSYKLNTDRLTREQIFALARDEISARDKRHARSAAVFLGLAVTFALMTIIVATLVRRSDQKGDMLSSNRVHAAIGVRQNVDDLYAEVQNAPVANPYTEALRDRSLNPVVDLKLVNGSESTQYFHEVSLIATRASFVRGSEYSCAHTEASGSYDVAFDLKQSRQSYTVPISHALRPGEADRFLIFVAATPDSPAGTGEFRIVATVKGLDGSEIILEPITVSVSQLSCTYTEPRKAPIQRLRADATN